MLTTNQIITLFGVAFDKAIGSPSSVPTSNSISRINNALGIVLPNSFVDFAGRCPAYTALFASVGVDFENGRHILSINRHFHSDCPGYCVPSWMIVLNYGHDGDCDGFDTRRLSPDGEHPIVYWDASDGINFDNARWPVYNSFHDYLEFLAVHYAKTKDKERTEQILQLT